MVTRRRFLLSTFGQQVSRLRLPYLFTPIVVSLGGSEQKDVTLGPAREKPPPPTPYRRQEHRPVRAPTTSFAARSQGSLRAFDFVPGTDIGPDARKGTWGSFGYTGDPASLVPSLDQSQGLNALRFDVPGKTGSAASCEWYWNFSEDLRTQLGPGSRFFLQWRQRFNRAMCKVMVIQKNNNGQSGVKQVIVSCQDRPGRHYDSCTLSEIVLTSFYNWRLLSMYYGCQTGTDLNDYTVHGKYQFQNQVGGEGCYWQQTSDGGGPIVPPAYPTGCAGWVPDEWMTFQIGVDVGPAVGPVANQGTRRQAYLGSRVRLWTGREGQASRLVHDIHADLFVEDPATPSAYGKAWFGPYMTGKDPTLDHPLMQTWIAEIIVSTNPIPDPVTGTLLPLAANSSQPSSAGTAPRTSLSSLQAGRIRALGNFSSGALTPARLEYGSLVFDPKRSRILLLAGGGHTSGATNDAGAFTGKVPFDVLYPSDTPAQQAQGFLPDTLIYAATNHLAAIHTFIGGCVRGDRYYLMTNGGSGVPAKYGMSYCDFATYQWSAIPLAMPWYYVSSAEVDPVSGKVVVLAADKSYYAAMWLFDPDAITIQGPIKISQFGNSTVPPDILYDPATDTFICIDPILVQVHELKLDRTGFARTTWTLIPTTGDIPSGFGENASAFARLPDGRITGFVRNGKCYVFDPRGRSWSSLVLTNEDGTPSSASSTYAYLALDPASGCVIFMEKGNVYAYRV